jgi:hypothetical protein
MVNGAIGVIGATAASRAGKVSRKESEFVTTRRQVEVYIYIIKNLGTFGI